MQQDDNYENREQSKVKHLILEEYLLPFAMKVGHKWDSISFIDGFSGPWSSKSEDYDDTSFKIAINQLRKAQDQFQSQFQETLQINCLFIENNQRRYQELLSFADKISNANLNLRTLNKSFSDASEDIVEFINKHEKSFPFIFIDPTGWSSHPMENLTRIFQIKRCEALINLMSSFIYRFIGSEDEKLRKSFDDLFGDSGFRDQLRALSSSEEKIDAFVFEYADRIAKAGKFKYVQVAVVPNPYKDSLHFHLIYATNSPAGVEVFKQAENKVFKQVPILYTDAKNRKAEAATGQSDLFSGNMCPKDEYFEKLTRHYSNKAKQAIKQPFKDNSEVNYDEVFRIAMRYPLFTERELKKWIADHCEVIGLAEGKRVPKPNSGHRIKMRSP